MSEVACTCPEVKWKIYDEEIVTFYTLFSLFIPTMKNFAPNCHILHCVCACTDQNQCHLHDDIPM